MCIGFRRRLFARREKIDDRLLFVVRIQVDRFGDTRVIYRGEITITAGA